MSRDRALLGCISLFAAFFSILQQCPHTRELGLAGSLLTTIVHIPMSVAFGSLNELTLTEAAHGFMCTLINMR